MELEQSKHHMCVLFIDLHNNQHDLVLALYLLTAYLCTAGDSYSESPWTYFRTIC